jgi:hypothetical protein
MFSSYVILGDDLVIADSNVAESYKGLLLELGMDYSAAKTHVSKDSFEFAKRWFIQRQEVTPFSIGGFESVKKSFTLLHNFLTNQATHGWLLPEGKLAATLISELLGACKLPQIAKRVCKLYGVYEYVLSARKVGGAISKDLLLLLTEGLMMFNTVPAVFPKDPKVIEKMTSRALKEAQRDVYVRDLRKFQEKLPSIMETYQEWFFEEFPGLRSKPGSLAFLPGFIVFARAFDRSLEAIRSPESLEEGLVAHYVSLGKALPDKHLRANLGDAIVVKTFVSKMSSILKEYLHSPTVYLTPPVIKEMVWEKVAPEDDPLGLMAAWSDPLNNIEERPSADEIIEPDGLLSEEIRCLDWLNLSELKVSPVLLLEDQRRAFYKASRGEAMPVQLPSDIERYLFFPTSS